MRDPRTHIRCRWRRAPLLLFLVALGLVLPAAPSGAQAQLTAEPSAVRPGGTVTLYGLRGFANNKAADVHLDLIDGPVLASFPVTGGIFGPATVTIPADTKVGNHVLVITQPLDATNAGVRGLPARAAVMVTGAGGVPSGAPALLPTASGRSADLAYEKEARPVGSLVLVGLGVAAAALLVAALGATVVRGRGQPRAKVVTPSRRAVVPSRWRRSPWWR